MADWQATGHISNIKYLPDCILIWIDEYEKGYVKTNGQKIDDRIISWRCIFSGNEAKGKLYPYAIQNGKQVDGYTVILQTINIACYPKRMLKQEKKMTKESQESFDGTPNLDEYNAPDF
jgi:hypothetical protein